MKTRFHTSYLAYLVCAAIALLISIAPLATAEGPLKIESAVFEQLGDTVQGYVDDNLIVGGEMMIIQSDKIVYHKSFGLSDRDSKTAWENDRVCNIRSMTKTFTSAAAQILIDRGELDLDAAVGKYIPSFDNEKCKSITVRQVLSHRSGLPLTNITDLGLFKSLAEQVDAAGEVGPKFPPGSKFWYSDLGTDVVGRLVEVISKQPIDQFVESEILKPLGMANSFYGIAGTKDRLAKVASPYMKTGGDAWMPFWKPGSEPMYNFAWGSQTLFSTPHDYARFLRMLSHGGRVGNKQLLTEAAVQRMLAPISRAKGMGSDTDAPTGFTDLEPWYGQMLVNYRKIGNTEAPPVAIGHSGSDGTIGWVWPERDMIAMFFTQSRGSMAPLRIEYALDRLVLNPAASDPANIPAALKPYFGSFTANYGNFDNEEFKVYAKGNKLILDIPSQLPFELLPADSDGKWAFAISPKQIQVSFDRDASDEVTGLTLHQNGKEYSVPLAGSPAAKRESDAKARANSTKEIWAGTIDAGPQKLRVEVEIARGESKSTGLLRSLDQGGVEIPLADIVVDAKRLQFKVPAANATYSGTLDSDGNVSSGTFTQNGADMALKLSKSATPAAKKSEGTLREAWVGSISVSGQTPVMQFRIMLSDDGKTTAFFDSVSEGQGGFKATWSIKDDQLSFDVAQIKLKYRGKLNAGKDKAVGTWSQGGRSLPLVLTKQAKRYGE